MAENVYEGMFILDSNRYARDPGGVAGAVDQLIMNAGGEILVSRLWEERRLAYPIKGHRKGTYWLAYFRLPSLNLKDLNRQCEIDDAILRHLMLKVDPRLVETLVAHASAEHVTPVGPTAIAAVEVDAEAETVGAGADDE